MDTLVINKETAQKEIERKFVINNTKWLDEPIKNSYEILQGYFPTDSENSKRIRILKKNNIIDCRLNVKQNINLISRYEKETIVPLEQAKQLITECDKILTKTRYIINFDNKKWEIDVFHSGEILPLTLAEVELTSENEIIKIPTWVDKEVTGIANYYNENIASRHDNKIVEDYFKKNL